MSDTNSLPRLLCDEPTKELGGDPFAFSPFVDTFVDLATNKDNGTPFTIVIDGKWGSGKTTLMRMTEEGLKTEKVKYDELVDHDKQHSPRRPCRTFWFNAWKYSNEDHILAALLLEIFRGLMEDEGFLTLWDPRLDAKELFIGGLYSAFKKVTGIDVTNAYRDVSAAENAAFFDQFVDVLRKLIEKSCAGEKADDKGAFVIFIDDLDRCPPAKTVKVLEAVKLFLDIPGCVFFLGMEVDQVKKAVKAEYEKVDEFDVDRYMEKLTQVHVQLPETTNEKIGEYLKGLFSDLKRPDKAKDSDIASVLNAAEFTTQRSLKRAVNDFLFMETLSGRMKDLDVTPVGLAKWIVLKNQVDPAIRYEVLNDTRLMPLWESFVRDKKESVTIDGVTFVWEEYEAWKVEREAKKKDAKGGDDDK